MNIVDLVQGFANVGITIFCIVAAILIVNWLDKNVFDKKHKGDKQMIELTCKKCDDATIMCDEGVVSVTCSMCVMIDVEVCDD